MAAHDATRAAVSARAQRASRLRGIYLIVNEEGSDTIALARAAVDAGIAIVQYRAKRGIVAQTLQELRALTHDAGALLIVNDDIDAALRFDCDGVHLGPDDADFNAVGPIRAAAGQRLVGLSCGTVAEAFTANSQDVDYLGVGSVYATASKADAGVPIGLNGLQSVAAASRFPVAAIGGIGERNVAEVARSGVAMAAVLSAMSGAGDPAAAARHLVRAWEAAQR